jgi:hypothetical protein
MADTNQMPFPAMTDVEKAREDAETREWIEVATLAFFRDDAEGDTIYDSPVEQVEHKEQ